MKILRHAFRRSTQVKLLLCWLLAIGSAQMMMGAGPILHKPAPEFVRLDFNNRRLDLRSFRGKVVLLNFWATWCAPCQIEMSQFAAWQSKYGPRCLQLIGISMDDDPELALRLVKKLTLNYPVAMGDLTLGRLYGGVLGLPTTYLIDKHGRVEAKFQGEVNLASIEEHFKAILSQ